MQKEPYLSNIGKKQYSTVRFGGINRLESASDGEMSDCLNLTAKEFPVLSVAEKSRCIMEHDNLTDVFWHKDGYLLIEGGFASYIRAVERENVTVGEEGWHERFTYGGYEYTVGAEKMKVYIKEKLPATSVGSLKGLIISFDGGGKTYTVNSSGHEGSGKYYKVYFYITVDPDTVLEEAKAWDKIYTKSNETTCLTVTSGTNNQITRTLQINEALSEEEIEKLRDIRFTMEFSPSSGSRNQRREIKISSGVTENGITFLTFDRDIYKCNKGSLIYPLSLNPPYSPFSKSEIIDNEDTGYIGKDEEYIILKDAFSDSLSEEEKKICAVGNIICIFPDKICYDTANNIFFKMEESMTVDENNWSFTADSFVIESGSFFDCSFVSGDMVLFSFAGTEDAVKETYTPAENCISAIIRGIENRKLTFDSNTFAEFSSSSKGKMRITREVPDLEHICAKGERLCGVCKDTIYLSKYGDPTNFQFFEGSALDSYYITASRGSGKFTGCIDMSGYTVFFREKEIIKLYGDVPSDYQLVMSTAEGVMEGAEKSLAKCAGAVYYLGCDGIYAYSGSFPVRISDALALENPKDAVGICDSSRYFVFLKTETEQRTYVYDCLKGIWLSYDLEPPEKFIRFDGDIDYISGGKLFASEKGGREDFSVTFCPMNEQTFSKKKYSAIYLRAEVGEGSYFTIETKTDGLFKPLKTVKASSRRLVSIPIMPQRTDELTIRISGFGDIKIISMMREYITGSERL